jgi:hypothetical protein
VDVCLHIQDHLEVRKRADLPARRIRDNIWDSNLVHLEEPILSLPKPLKIPCLTLLLTSRFGRVVSCSSAVMNKRAWLPCPSSNSLGQSELFGDGGSGSFGESLSGFQLMFQSSLFDGVAFDPFSFQKDGSASAEVDVGRCQVP